MIFDLFLLLILQPLLPSFFLFLPSIIYDFFKNNFKSLNLKIFIYSFLADLIFLKPFGFFLFLISLSFLFLSFLEKIITSEKFWQRFLFLIFLNFIFLVCFFYFSKLNFNFKIFIKFFLFNLLWQIIYFEVRKILSR